MNGTKLEQKVAEYIAGGRRAFDYIYECTNRAVYFAALYTVRDKGYAEDVMQETFVRAHLAAGSYSSQGKPTAWLLRITRNLALMRLREGGKSVTMSPEDWMEEFADRPDFTAEDAMTLTQLMDALSDEEREIVTLHALTGFKHREIAAMLDLALPTVLSKYHRAIKKLKSILQGG